MYIKDLLSEKYGQQVIEQGGLKIITTIDLEKQKAGKKRMKAIGKVNVPQEAFMAVLKI